MFPNTTQLSTSLWRQKTTDMTTGVTLYDFTCPNILPRVGVAYVRFIYGLRIRRKSEETRRVRVETTKRKRNETHDAFAAERKRCCTDHHRAARIISPKYICF